jgi:hypothetical protein
MTVSRYEIRKSLIIRIFISLFKDRKEGKFLQSFPQKLHP